MPLKIEVCGADLNSWNSFNTIMPGYAEVIGQVLPDGEKTYLANCDCNGEEAVIYESNMSQQEFRRKLESEGVHENEDFMEKVKLQKGDTYKLSVKISPVSPRYILRFIQE